MERGLYGQTETDAPKNNASQQRFADVESEGTGYAVPTENEFRHKMADQVSQEIDWSRQENKARKPFGDHQNLADRSIHVQIARVKQTSALNALGDVVEEMYQAGYSHDVVVRTLTVAPAVAYAKKAGASARKIAPKSAGVQTIRLRAKAGMYSIDRDARTTTEGAAVANVYDTHRKEMADARKG